MMKLPFLRREPRSQSSDKEKVIGRADNENKLIFFSLKRNLFSKRLFKPLKEAARTFDRFHNLPFELRHQIWELAMLNAKPQVIRLVPKYGTDVATISFTWGRATEEYEKSRARMSVEPLLIVNRESRNVALKDYSLIHPKFWSSVSGRPTTFFLPFRINFKKDTLHIGKALLKDHNQFGSAFTWWRLGIQSCNQFRKIRFIAFEISLCDPFPNHLKQDSLPSLVPEQMVFTEHPAHLYQDYFSDSILGNRDNIVHFGCLKSYSCKLCLATKRWFGLRQTLKILCIHPDWDFSVGTWLRDQRWLKEFGAMTRRELRVTRLGTPI